MSHIHVCISTYLHTCIYILYVHIFRARHIWTCISAYVNTDIYTCIYIRSEPAIYAIIYIHSEPSAWCRKSWLTFTSAHLHLYTHTCIHVHTQMYAYAHIHIYTHTQRPLHDASKVVSHTYLYIYTCAQFTCVHACKYAHVYTHTHTHTTHIRPRSFLVAGSRHRYPLDVWFVSLTPNQRPFVTCTTMSWLGSTSAGFQWTGSTPSGFQEHFRADSPKGACRCKSCLTHVYAYGVATIRRLHKIIGLFCRISSVL